MADLSPEVQAERDRCEKLVRALGDHWIAKAAGIRTDGSFTVRELWPPPFKKVTVVRPGWERQAALIEDAGNALHLFAGAIRDGLNVK